MMVKPLILKDKIALREGYFNGLYYSVPELKKLFAIYQKIEKKNPDSRTIEERHATSLFKGSAQDHQDSSGTWSGKAEGVYWDDKEKAIGFRKLEIVDQDLVGKIEFQMEKKESCFGISPRLSVLRQGNNAVEIKPKNLAVVLQPAGDLPVMLSSDNNELESGREIVSDIVEEITLSEKNLLGVEGGFEMTPEEIKALAKELSEERNKDKEKMEKELSEVKAKSIELEATLKKLQDEKKKKEEEMTTSEEEAKKKAEEEAKKKAEEEMAKKKLAEEEGGEEKEKKYKYYGMGKKGTPLSVLQSLTPNVALLGSKDVERVAEDLVDAITIFTKGEYTLEQAQKAVEEIHKVMLNLPRNEKDEVAALKRVEESLSAGVTERVEKEIEKKIGTLVLPGSKTRKGLISKGSEREEESLSKKKVKSPEDIKSEIVSSLGNALRVN